MVSLSDLIRAHLAYGGLTYSMEVEEPLMREIPVGDVVMAILQAVDEWLSVECEGCDEHHTQDTDSDLTEVELFW